MKTFVLVVAQAAMLVLAAGALASSCVQELDKWHRDTGCGPEQAYFAPRYQK